MIRYQYLITKVYRAADAEVGAKTDDVAAFRITVLNYGGVWRTRTKVLSKEYEVVV